MVSVNVHNAHPASACAIRWMKWCVHNTYTHPHLFEIFVKTPQRNCTTPNLPSRSCMGMYGQPDSLVFFSLEFFALLDWTRTGTVQSVDFVLRVFYLKATSREYFSYVLISVRSTISNACVICFGLGVRIWRSPSTSNATKGCRSDVKLQSFHKFQHSLWTLPWN